MQRNPLREKQKGPGKNCTDIQLKKHVVCYNEIFLLEQGIFSLKAGFRYRQVPFPLYCISF